MINTYDACIRTYKFRESTVFLNNIWAGDRPILMHIDNAPKMCII